MPSKWTDRQGRAFKKSQLQVQIYVNRRRVELESAIRAALPGLDRAVKAFRWVSPLESEKFREYRDRSFLDAVERPELAGALSEFWPPGGAHWDALAILELLDGGQGVLLVEAKSYVAEMTSSMKAKDPGSVGRIRRALSRTKVGLGATPSADWTVRYYQAANRLAHLAFLNERGVRSWLVHLCIVDDPDHPTSLDEWRAGIDACLKHLGLASLPFGQAAEVFLPGRRRSDLLDGPPDGAAAG